MTITSLTYKLLIHLLDTIKNNFTIKSYIPEKKQHKTKMEIKIS